MEMVAVSRLRLHRFSIALTLLSSLDKEQWLPLLEGLFQCDQLNIAEAWSMDIYNHGDSLPYNKDLVLASPDTCTVFFLLSVGGEVDC